MDTSSVLFAFGLTLLAGLATGIGSLLAFFTRSTNTRFLSAALGLSAGVMLYVSFRKSSPGPGFTCLGFRENRRPRAALGAFLPEFCHCPDHRPVPAGDNPMSLKRWKNSQKHPKAAK